MERYDKERSKVTLNEEDGWRQEEAEGGSVILAPKSVTSFKTENADFNKMMMMKVLDTKMCVKHNMYFEMIMVVNLNKYVHSCQTNM